MGTPTRGFALRAGYAWTRTEITQDTLGFSGNALPNAPEHKVSVWARYAFPGTPSRLSLAAGVVHASDRFSTRANVVRIPSYTRLDANVLVDLVPSRLGLALVSENLTNARYVTSGTATAFFAGPPRRLAATLTARF